MSEAFHKFALLGKGGLILTLLVLAIVNGHTEYVEKNPRSFMIDALSTGLFGALAGVWLAATRGRPDLFLNHFIFALLLFFLYHVCREFAGYFTVFGSEPLTGQEKKEENILKWPVMALMPIFGIIAIVLAVRAHVAPDYSESVFSWMRNSSSWKVPFAFETFVFAFIVSIGEVIVAQNHGDSAEKSFATSMAMFIAASCVLQAGGLYEHLYSAPPPCIQ
jgi:hypothetical protein